MGVGEKGVSRKMGHRKYPFEPDISSGPFYGAGIFLLKGDVYEPVYPAGFQRDLEERAEIVRLLGTAP